MKTYKEFVIKTEPFIPDILTGFLWELEISGITEENDSLKIYSESGKISSKEIEEKLNELILKKIILLFSVEEKEFEEKNWNEEWEKSINVIEVSDKVVIKPSFRNYEPKKNQIIITIDPKMSFGTGEHQTTKMMIQLIEKYVKENDKVLDVGSGTGILAIAAVKLGAKNALAFDNDEWCYDNGIENAEINFVKDKVEFKCAEIQQIEEKDFDLILANIQKNILLEISEEIKKRIKKGGTLLLSGLLIQDEEDIIRHYENSGFKFLEKTQSGEWIAIAMVF